MLEEETQYVLWNLVAYLDKRKSGWFQWKIDRLRDWEVKKEVRKAVGKIEACFQLGKTRNLEALA